MARSKTFADGELLHATDVNSHLVNHVPNPGDVFDTGWTDVPLAAGFTANNAVQVRRIGLVIYWRGRVSRGAGEFPADSPVNIVAAGGVPAWARPLSTFSETAAVTTNGASTWAHLSADTVGGVALRAASASNNFFMAPLSGYTAG